MGNVGSTISVITTSAAQTLILVVIITLIILIQILPLLHVVLHINTDITKMITEISTAIICSNNICNFNITENIVAATSIDTSKSQNVTTTNTIEIVF